MTLCVRWIYEDDLELQSEIPKYCDHGYCHGKRGPTMSCDRCWSATRPLAEGNGEMLCHGCLEFDISSWLEANREAIEAEAIGIIVRRMVPTDFEIPDGVTVFHYPLARISRWRA